MKIIIYKQDSIQEIKVYLPIQSCKKEADNMFGSGVSRIEIADSIGKVIVYRSRNSKWEIE